jgi:hypothetical protein
MRSLVKVAGKDMPDLTCISGNDDLYCGTSLAWPQGRSRISAVPGTEAAERMFGFGVAENHPEQLAVSFFTIRPSSAWQRPD